MKKAGSGRATKLLAAQVVAHPNHSLGDEVAAKLVSQAISIMDIELWANEQMFGHENLHADSKVLLKMAGSSDRRSLRRTHSCPDTTALGDGKRCARASDSGFQVQRCPFRLNRPVYRIEIVE